MVAQLTWLSSKGILNTAVRKDVWFGTESRGQATMREKPFLERDSISRDDMRSFGNNWVTWGVSMYLGRSTVRGSSCTVANVLLRARVLLSNLSKRC